MRQQKLRSVIVGSLATIALLTISPLTTYAHPPSATGMPDKSHIHIQGRVTTPEGNRLPVGLGLRINDSVLFTGLPEGCLGLGRNVTFVPTALPMKFYTL